MNRQRRFVVLLGILVALVSFYVGLNMWISSKKEEAQPLPVVVKPKPQEKPQEQPSQPVEAMQKPQEKPQEQLPAPPTPQPTKEEKRQDVIAQKIQEEKKIPEEKAPQQTQEEKVRKMRSYTVQVGAFSSRENALKALSRAKSMGYKNVNIKEEDGFYKVLINLRTDNINQELRKLRLSFGGAILR